jgi:hypothetical protein
MPFIPDASKNDLGTGCSIYFCAPDSLILKVQAARQCTVPCEHVRLANVCISMVCVGLSGLCEAQNQLLRQDHSGQHPLHQIIM